MTSTTTLQRFTSFLRKLHPTYNAHPIRGQSPVSRLPMNPHRTDETPRRVFSQRTVVSTPRSSHPVRTPSKCIQPPFQRGKTSSKTRHTMSTLRNWLDTRRTRFDNFFRAKASEKLAKLCRKRRCFPSTTSVSMETIFEGPQAPPKPPRGILRSSAAPQRPPRGIKRIAVAPQGLQREIQNTGAAPPKPPRGIQRSCAAPQRPPRGMKRTAVAPQRPPRGIKKTSAAPQRPPRGVKRTCVAPQKPPRGIKRTCP